MFLQKFVEDPEYRAELYEKKLSELKKIIAQEEKEKKSDTSTKRDKKKIDLEIHPKHNEGMNDDTSTAIEAIFNGKTTSVVTSVVLKIATLKKQLASSQKECDVSKKLVVELQRNINDLESTLEREEKTRENEEEMRKELTGLHATKEKRLHDAEQKYKDLEKMFYEQTKILSAKEELIEKYEDERSSMSKITKVSLAIAGDRTKHSAKMVAERGRSLGRQASTRGRKLAREARSRSRSLVQGIRTVPRSLMKKSELEIESRNNESEPAERSIECSIKDTDEVNNDNNILSEDIKHATSRYDQESTILKVGSDDTEKSRDRAKKELRDLEEENKKPLKNTSTGEKCKRTKTSQNLTSSEDKRLESLNDVDDIPCKEIDGRTRQNIGDRVADGEQNEDSYQVKHTEEKVNEIGVKSDLSENDRNIKQDEKTRIKDDRHEDHRETNGTNNRQSNSDMRDEYDVIEPEEGPGNNPVLVRNNSFKIAKNTRDVTTDMENVRDISSIKKTSKEEPEQNLVFVRDNSIKVAKNTCDEVTVEVFVDSRDRSECSLV